MKRPISLTPQQISMIANETSLEMEHWAKKSNLPNYTSQWFKCARDEAFLSNFHTAKMGCVFVYKNHVIGRGHNQHKTDPLQKEYNQKYRDWTATDEFSQICGHTLHAEIAALKSISYPTAQQTVWKRVQVYVYRVGLGLESYSGLALPCQACANALSDIGIREVFYTTGHVDKPFGRCDL